jgi:hypothetical protein
MGKVMWKQFANFMELLVNEMHHQLTVKRMIKKYEETGSSMDSKLPVRHCSSRSLDNFAAVSESVAESPGTLLRHHSQQLGIPRSTIK